VEALGTIDARSPEGSRALGEALNDSDPMVRAAATKVAGIQPRIARDNLTRLGELLEDESPEVRKAAAKAIGNLGVHGAEKLDALERAAVSDSEEEVRLTAARAVETIQKSQSIAQAVRPQDQVE
jgi:HEAT repeat protein